MAIRIPTTNLASYIEVVTIDSIAYTLSFNFNTRDNSWFMSIATSNGDIIVSGIKILPGVNLTGRFKDARLPITGDFICVNITDSITPPGRNDLLEEIQIWFLSKEEISNLSDGFVRVV